jgi:hypothetical protein
MRFKPGDLIRTGVDTTLWASSVSIQHDPRGQLPRGSVGLVICQRGDASGDYILALWSTRAIVLWVVEAKVMAA